MGGSVENCRETLVRETLGIGERDTSSRLDDRTHVVEMVETNMMDVESVFPRLALIDFVCGHEVMFDVSA